MKASTPKHSVGVHSAESYYINTFLKNQVKMCSIPDRNGERFCHDCKDFLPVSSFPSGAKRYQCTEHLQKRMKLARQNLYEKDGESKQIARMHHASYEDTRAVFKKKGVSISQKAVKELFASAGASINPLYRLVPEDPENTLSVSNVLVVSSAVRKHLVKAFVVGGPKQYHNALIQWVGKA
jgi:hypothetical protein